MSNTLTYNGEELPIVKHTVNGNLVVLYKGENRIYDKSKEELSNGDDWKHYCRFKTTNRRI